MSENKHDEREHAVLSPSTAERWFNCPGSIRLSGNKRSVSGAAAITGTEAHEYASNILLEETDLESIPDDDMREAVERYVEFIENLEDSYGEAFDYFVEDRVNLSHLGGDCWGTLDYASWVVGKDLYVIDYKHGLVTVEVKDNKQLLTYATGVCEEIGYDFRYIFIVIVQPRAAHVNGPIRSYRYPPESIQKFRDKGLKPAIKETKHANATLKSGSWCQYCPAIGNCPEIVGTAQKLARIEFAETKNIGANTDLPHIETVTDDQLALIIEHAKVFKPWIEGCQQEAVNRIEKGSSLNGLKLVRSPGRARWRDPDNLPTEFTRAVPLTITEARKQFDDVEQYIERPEGIIVAVPDTDGRALYISPKVEFE